MNFYVLTLFPEMVEQVMNTSIIGRAVKNGILRIEAVNIRDFSDDRHRKTDDYPYGGGAGMVMQAQPVYDAWESVSERSGEGMRCIYLTPQGRRFDQAMAKELAREKDLIFLCGHYEGVDERVLEEIVTDPVSIGDYVLSGGELAAMVMIDAVSRMVPGVLTNEESGTGETFEGNLLEYPQYSRPPVWNGREVPEILFSGDHAKVEEWRHRQSVARTWEHRPDLLEKADLTAEDAKLLLELEKSRGTGNR